MKFASDSPQFSYVKLTFLAFFVSSKMALMVSVLNFRLV
ncbi:hypothetical protein LEP1GSC073_1996 [Leptospira noguchii str. Cascata]|nr:hypothetical protein LEP1GSC073_1996 [Leptospira noguchii str. Cascata]